MLSPTENDAMQLLAHAYLQNARPEKAATLFGAIDAVAPGQLAVLRGLVLAQLRCGHGQQALDTLERVQLAGGVDAAFHLARARALAACGRAAEATAAMAACIAMRQSASRAPSQAEVAA